VRVVVGRDEGGAGAGDDARDDGLALGGRRAAEHDRRAVAARRGDLGRRRQPRHHDVRGDAHGGGGEGEGLRVVACCACVSLDARFWLGGAGRRRTAAMRDDAALAAAALGPAVRLRQPEQRVEGAARLERADALQVLALEPEAQRGLRGLLARPGRGGQLGRGARRGGEGGEVGVCEDGRAVDVGLDELVGGEDGGAG